MKECTLHLIKYHKSDREEVSTASEVSSASLVPSFRCKFCCLDPSHTCIQINYGTTAATLHVLYSLAGKT